MMRVLLGVVLSAAVALPAAADVTIKMTTGGKGMGMSTSSTGTTYIKGSKMRSDLQMGDKTQTTIFDLDAQKMYIFDSGKKEADVWDMAAFGKEIGVNIDTAKVQGAIKPNGKTKAFGSLTAAGYDMEISVPATMGGNKDMAMTVTMVGPVWIVKDAPGAAEYTRFYKTAAEKGWIFSDPRAAQGSPGQAKAMAQMYTEFAKTGGIPYETVMNIKPEGGGAMGGLMAKVGGMQTTTTTDSVEVGPLADELFQVPADYKLKQQ